MRKLLRITRTEVLEHWRQPAMLGVLVANYLLWILIFGGMYVALDQVSSRPEDLLELRRQTAAVGMDLDAVLRVSVSSFGSLVFTNLPLYVAIMSGYSVLHDRANGTLPFLMLAPLTRRQVLLGKLLGALAIPYALHLVFVGSSCLVLGRLELLGPYATLLGASPAWWFAYLVGAPSSAAVVGSLGSVISALSRDVRTSMQFTSFFIGLLSLGIGYALVDGVSWGLALQAAFAGGCLTVAGVILLVGARVISRDITGT